tara:strand:- start:87 stop:455 length:369 start_codon:yes stop_codon:yes gene_type:complete
MKNKDFNEIAKYEKAIKDKYGQEAIQNPKSTWDQEKEQEYLESLKEFYARKERSKTVTKKEGFDLVSAKKKRVSRTCPVCSAYSTKSIDDLYMLKFECCFNCYIQYIEGREERWKTGWRPNS